MSDEFFLDDEISKKLPELARKICVELGVDPDEIVDDYGPVRKLDGVLYALDKFICNNRMRPNPALFPDTLEAAAKAICLSENDELRGIIASELDKVLENNKYMMHASDADIDRIVERINYWNTRPLCSDTLEAAAIAEILPRVDDITNDDRRLGKEAAFLLQCKTSDGETAAIDLARDLRLFLEIRNLKGEA